jgi:hypothetical protein
MRLQSPIDRAPETWMLWRGWPFRLTLVTVLLAIGLALGACGGGGETGDGGATTNAGGGATAGGGTVGLNQLPSATEELGTSEGKP